MAEALVPLTFRHLAAQERVRHGITRKLPGWWRDGDVSLMTGGDPAAVVETRRAWGEAIGIEAAAAVAARQVHGKAVATVSWADRGRGATALGTGIPATDALLTDAPGVPLLMLFADCTPILFHDPRHGVVGIAHAGWRGTVADIAGETVQTMLARYGSNPHDLLVGIGPAIGRCCYVVDAPVIDAWATLGVDDPTVAEEITPADGRRQWRFDLARANRRLLERAGVPAGQIEDSGVCTSCNVAEFPSHRAEHGQAGRFAAMIALANAGDD
jgi:YfiH family protein